MPNDPRGDKRAYLCYEDEIALLQRIRQFARDGDIDQFIYDVGMLAITQKIDRRIEHMSHRPPAGPLVTAPGHT